MSEDDVLRKKAVENLYLLTRDTDAWIAVLESQVSLLHLNNQFKVQVMNIEI